MNVDQLEIIADVLTAHCADYQLGDYPVRCSCGACLGMEPGSTLPEHLAAEIARALEAVTA